MSEPAFRVRRLPGNPILHRDTTTGVGRNINGPSLVLAPPWIDEPLGRYYLYFAHHRGTFIRLATADRLDGPWSVYEPGTLRLAESHFPADGRRPHIASPDVHVDTATQTVRMYYHGLDTATRVQHTRVALSGDGIHFEAQPELLGRPYFRVFQHDRWWYALAMPGIVYRSADGLSGFERGPMLFDRTMRHSALLVRGDELLVFWSRVGDSPERILCSPVALDGDWRGWRRRRSHGGARSGGALGGGGRTARSVGARLGGRAGLPAARPGHLPRRTSAPTCSTPSPGSPVSPSPNSIRRPRAPVTSGPVAAGRTGRTRAWQRLREASVTMAAVLASFGTALLIEREARLTASIVILAVALALSIGRVSSRQGSRSALLRLLGVLVLPLVAVGANEIGMRMFEHPNLGDTLFVVAVSATIWVRRFGPLATRVGTLVTLPLIATLVVPVVGGAGSGSSGDQRWWAALVAIVALGWVSAAQLLAERTGLLARPETVPEPPPATSSGGSRRRLPASTKMALQMAAALAAAFAIGRTLYPSHWTWVVLTAFIVCSGNRGRGDVVHKAIMRTLGATAGTLAASVLASLVPAGNRWSIAAIFAVLAVALWLRPLSYAYWAAGVTAALALLYGYYGEHGVQLLGDRLEEIVVGAMLGVAASWLLLPVRTTDVLRRDLARALAALSDYLAAIDDSPSALRDHQARFARSATDLDRIGNVLRLTPRRWRIRRDYLPAVVAMKRSAAALPAVTDYVTSKRFDVAALTDLRADVGRLRGGLAQRAEQDAAAWTRLADAIERLPLTVSPAVRPSPSPRRMRRRQSRSALGVYPWRSP